MNLHNRLSLTLALVTLAGITAAGAEAATVVKGTFTLPSSAYWNGTLLEPGAYTVSVDRSVSGVETVSVRGEGMAAVFLASPGSDKPGHSYLKVDDLNGTYVIRELEAAPVGKSYRFGVSKKVQKL